jgi:hypothetical protein
MAIQITGKKLDLGDALCNCMAEWDGGTAGRRLRNHRCHDSESKDEAPDDGEIALAIDAGIRIVIRSLSAGDAVMDLASTGQQFVIFRNAGHGQINIVHWGADGAMGRIRPGDVLGAG